VLVLEALFAGAGATGNTTAKISLLQGTKMSKIVAKQGQKRARQYVEGNREGREWLIGHCENHGLSVQREDAFTYAQSEKVVHAAREELEACTAAGLAVDWVDEADVPFPFHGGVRLANQAQSDRMPLLDSLIVELDECGGRLAQGVRVQHVSGDGDRLRMDLRTIEGDTFSVNTGQCVLATGIPILDRGGFFTRLKPNRSYCMAYRLPGNITRGMYISAGSPTLIGTGTRLLGEDALSGCDADALLVGAGLLADRRASLRRPDTSRQRQHLRGNGFRQVGHDKRRGAALALSSRILGGRMDWADAFASWSPHELSGIPKAMQNNMEGGSVAGDGLDHTGDTLG
jgi:FAD dependent oxidoreductase